MKRTALAVIVLASAAACGGDGASGSAADTSTASATSVTTAATTVTSTTTSAAATTTAAPASSTAVAAPGANPLVLAVDAATGSERFSLPVDAASDTFSGMVVDGELLVGLGGQCDGETPAARAFDRLTGEQRWSTPLAGHAELSGPLSTDGGVIVLATRTDETAQLLTHLTGLDTTTGQPRWELELGTVTDVQLALDQPVVLASYEPAAQDGGPFTLVAIDRATGQRRWESTTPGVAIVGTDGEVVVVQSFDEPPAMVGLDAATGGERWREEGIEPTYVPRLGGGVVANTVSSGGVAGFDVATGERRWERPDLVLPELVEGQAGTGGTQVLLAPAADPAGTTLELVELADGRTLFPVPNESGLIPTEHALLLGQDETLAVHALSDGGLVGEIALPPAEPDQVVVLPAVAGDLTVYLGRGCPGRG
jgi:outer membrane protein assembly factor BamB